MSEFRYDRIVEIKEKLLEQKQRDLETARDVAGSRSRGDRPGGGRVGRTYNDMATRRLTGKELSMLIGHLSYLDASKKQLLDEKRDREKKAVVIRNALLALEMELKVFEKLKFRVLQRIKKARNRKEQKLMDDLALRTEAK